MNVSQGVQNNDEILKILEKFGFKFFGYNESNLALVIAPNGQVVDVNTAYKFLQVQLQSAHNTANPAGVEAGPQMPVVVSNVENLKQVDQSVEQIERDIEKADNKVEKVNEQNPVQQPVEHKAPKITIPESAPSIYSDGYSKFESIDLDLRNPENVTKLEAFIQNNARKSNSDPAKWLSYMFQKTLQELTEGNTN